MKILALDTSSLAASCAWMEDGRLIGETFINTSLTHSQTIMPMLRSMLDNIGCEPEDADILAVSAGPGSFTGLRIGMSAVKGMAMVTGKPCAAVSTLWSLAINLTSHRGYIATIMDARRNQFYFALFHSDGIVTSRVAEDQLISCECIYDMLQPLDSVVLVGDGALLCRDLLGSKGMDVIVAPPCLLHQRAGSICVAAAELASQGSLVDANSLLPVYLRLPQAERERLEKESS